MAKVLKNGDLELRTFSVNEAPKLFYLVNDNRKYLEVWLPWLKSVKTPEGAGKKIKVWERKEKKGEGINFGIWTDSKLIGVISFNFIDKIDKKAEIGYWLDKNYQGRGIMTKSCELLIKYGFSDLMLHRLEISCAKENDKSCAIPERLGFTKEGLFRESAYLNGKFVDFYLYSLLEHEWKTTN